MTSPRTHRPTTSKAAQDAVVNATPKAPARASGTVAKPTNKTVVKPAKAKTVKLSFGTVTVPDLTVLVSRKPTQNLLDFLSWMSAATGIEFTAEQRYVAAMVLPVGLRHAYQAAVRDANPSAKGSKAAK